MYNQMYVPTWKEKWTPNPIARWIWWWYCVVLVVKGSCCCSKLIWIPKVFFVTFSWAVKVFSHFHGFTNWKQTLKGKKFEQKKDPRKGQGERGRFCVIQMRFAIVGQARNEQQQQQSDTGWSIWIGPILNTVKMMWGGGTVPWSPQKLEGEIPGTKSEATITV